MIGKYVEFMHQWWWAVAIICLLVVIIAGRIEMKYFDWIITGLIFGLWGVFELLICFNWITI